MITKTEKMQINPALEQGRWYRAFVESDGSTVTLTSTDIYSAVLNGNYIQMPTNFHIVDVKMDVNTSGGTSSSASTLNYGIRRFGTGVQGVILPDKTAYDYLTAYIFGYDE